MNGNTNTRTRTIPGLFIPGSKTLTSIALAMAFSQVQAADINLLSRDRPGEYTVSATSSDLIGPVSYINDGRRWTAWSNRRSETFYNDSVNVEFEVPSQVSSISVQGSTGKLITLEYFDGSDWQVAGSYHVTMFGTVQSVDNITAKKWRLRNGRGLDNDPASLTISELNMYGTPNPNAPVGNTRDGDTVIELAQAPVDECYFGVADERNIYPKPENEPCPAGSKEKRNESYLWGLTAYTDANVSNLYFGTGANVFCIGLQNYAALQIPLALPNSWACQNGFRNERELGDQRPPSIYIYDTKTDEMTRPVITAKAEKIRENTIGLRSAGQYEGIVFLAGPNSNKAISLFAFNGATGELLDATSYDAGFTSVRKMKEIEGKLHLAVGSAELARSSGGGAMLRWKGDPQAILGGDLSTLWDFDLVGTGMDAEATELEYFEGRIFAASWPNQFSKQGGGLWQSPDLPLSTDGTAELVWEAGVTDADHVTFTADGNLEILTSGGMVLFESATAGLGADSLVFHDNGRLAIYGADDSVLWSSEEGFAPVDLEVNAISVESAVRLYPGDTLYSGETLQSASGFATLAVVDGDLEVTSKSIPWTRVWGAEDYEPDAYIATTYGMGATVAKDGWIYWGTMHVPATQLFKYVVDYGYQVISRHPVELMTKGARAASLFRGRNLGTPAQEIEVLYGGYKMTDGAKPGEYPVHQFYEGEYGYLRNMGDYKYEMNKMGQVPKYGREGFNNALNKYLWNMINYNGDLYIGTFDLGEDLLPMPQNYGLNTEAAPGADMYKLDTENGAVEPVFLDGAVSPTSYGIRNTIVVDGAMYIGTASNASLDPDGGWRLMKLTADELE